ncbi:MAG: hypothetical protein Q9217_001407 [Psora testacea]
MPSPLSSAYEALGISDPSISDERVAIEFYKTPYLYHVNDIETIAHARNSNWLLFFAAVAQGGKLTDWNVGKLVRNWDGQGGDDEIDAGGDIKKPKDGGNAHQGKGGEGVEIIDLATSPQQNRRSSSTLAANGGVKRKRDDGNEEESTKEVSSSEDEAMLPSPNAFGEYPDDDNPDSSDSKEVESPSSSEAEITSSSSSAVNMMDSCDDDDIGGIYHDENGIPRCEKCCGPLRDGKCPEGDEVEVSLTYRDRGFASDDHADGEEEDEDEDEDEDYIAYDAKDDIWRCIFCQWEVEGNAHGEGNCHCLNEKGDVRFLDLQDCEGYHPADSDSENDLEDSLEEDEDEDDEEEEDDDDDEADSEDERFIDDSEIVGEVDMGILMGALDGASSASASGQESAVAPRKC